MRKRPKKKTQNTVPKTNMSTKKDLFLQRKYIFQPLIFKGHVSFRFPGGIPPKISKKNTCNSRRFFVFTALRASRTNLVVHHTVLTSVMFIHIVSWVFLSLRRSHEKKKRPYFPWNTPWKFNISFFRGYVKLREGIGWLRGILMSWFMK